MARIHDVSLPFREGMIRYPANPAPTIRRYAWIPRAATNESVLRLGSHAGTHVDAPLHVRRGAPGTASLPLDAFYGRCRVLDLSRAGREIRRGDLEGHDLRRREIVLLKTENSRRGYARFHRDFAHVKLDAAEALVDAGVKTLGFDYLSVKRFGGDDEVHELMIDRLALFEGLDLSGVREGTYTFLGLPLRLDCDGAPARVLLVED